MFSTHSGYASGCNDGLNRAKRRCVTCIIPAHFTQSKAMFNIIIRVVIIYLIVVFLMRLMGKRQIGELAPFELVIALMVADLAVIPLGEPTIPIWYGVVPLVVISIVHFFITFMTRKSPMARNVFSGKAAIIIQNGNMNLKELKKLNLSTEELQEELRNLNYANIGDVNYAIMETNGKISVIPKAAVMPATRQDMQVEPEPTKMFYCIVDDGKLLKNNFQEIGQQENISVIMSKILRQLSSETEKQVAFASIAMDGTVFAQNKNGTMQQLQISLPQPAETFEQKKQSKSGGGK